MRYCLTALAAVCLGFGTAAEAAVWNVSSISQFKAAMAAANPGDEIYVQYGVYHVTTADDHKHWFRRAGTPENPIRIIGVLNEQGDRPVFDASGTPIDRGIFYIWEYYSNYVIENLEFRNARGMSVLSNNAAAAYIKADNITFRNCYSHHNDNGWFSTDTAHNTVLEYCETAYNGKPPGTSGGLTHNHYMNSQSLTVRGCYIHHSIEGQNFKSRCSSVVFEYNWVEEDGNYSWELASNNVSNSLMIGNVIIKGRYADNSRIIGLSDGGAVYGTLTMINNTIVATSSNHRFIYSNANARTNLVLHNNIFVGPSTQLFSWYGTGTRTGSHNWFRSGMSVPAGITNSLFGVTPGFVDEAAGDYHLLPDSPARDAGLNNPQWLNPSGVWEVAVPDLEYLAVAQTSPRPDDGALDIGAYETFVQPGDTDGDGDVDVFDAITLANAFGSSPGDPNWDPSADFDGNGVVDVFDAITLVNNFGAGT